MLESDVPPRSTGCCFEGARKAASRTFCRVDAALDVYLSQLILIVRPLHELWPGKDVLCRYFVAVTGDSMSF